eukprot:12864-Heterococcus_DN1.PRE.1
MPAGHHYTFQTHLTNQTGTAFAVGSISHERDVMLRGHLPVGPVTMKLQAQLGQHDVGQLSIEHLDANSASAISLAPNQFGFSYNQVR